jgi:uncharacterized protein (TIGR04141 family)
VSKTKVLNIRLLREGVAIANSFAESFAPEAERALERRPWNGVEGAFLYIGQIYSNPPAWRPFLEAGSPGLPIGLFTAGAGAAIFLPVADRITVLCFGHVHIALNDDAFERQFGLKVTLNTVPRGQLRTLDLATPDAVTFQKRIQASKDSDLLEFGGDMLRDLARVAGGTPRDKSFAHFVAGKDSVSITCDVEVNSLQEKCLEVLVASRLSIYQQEFSWVDNLRRGMEKDVVAQLDEKVFEALGQLRAGNNSDLHMAPPEIVNYTEGSELHYNGFGSHGTTFHSLSIEDYVRELDRCGFGGDMTEIKEKHSVKAKSGSEDDYSEKWKIYNCFVFEASLAAETEEQYFVLFAGSWYRVEKEFKASVEAFFEALKKVNIIRSTTCRNERLLIDDIVATRPDLLKLDQQKINPDGVKYGNLEPCDFFSDKKQFIHLKDGHSSGSISHLWSQGVVSAEAFISDPVFRKKLRAKVKSLGGRFEVLLPKSNEKVERETFTVVYGIMRKPYADGSLGLPFFSKVSVRAAAERIAQFGIPLSIELIEKPASDEAAEGEAEE